MNRFHNLQNFIVMPERFCMPSGVTLSGDVSWSKCRISWKPFVGLLLWFHLYYNVKFHFDLSCNDGEVKHFWETQDAPNAAGSLHKPFTLIAGILIGK